MLGNGWYNCHSRCAWSFDYAPWRDRPKLLVQLRVVLADGRVETITSDGSWRATIGPVIRDGIRNGEVYDARREMPGWDTPDFDDASWAAAEVVQGPQGALRAAMLPPAKVMQTITPIKISEPKPGMFMVDMGQNLAGWVHLNVAGPAGSRVVMRYGERLTPEGMLDTKIIGQHVSKGRFRPTPTSSRGRATSNGNRGSPTTGSATSK